MRKSSYSLVNQPLSRHLRCGGSGGGGGNQRTQTKQLGMRRPLPPGSRHVDFRYREAGRVWWSVANSLRSSSPGLRGCTSPGSLPHRVMDFLRIFPPHFRIVAFPFPSRVPLWGSYPRRLLKRARTVRIWHIQATTGSELVAKHHGASKPKEFSNWASNQDPGTS